MIVRVQHDTTRNLDTGIVLKDFHVFVPLIVLYRSHSARQFRVVVGKLSQVTMTSKRQMTSMHMSRTNCTKVASER